MKRLILLSTLLVVAISVQAQPITLGECIQLAMDNYPEVKQFDLIEKSSQFTIENTRTAYLPQISFSSQATYQNAVASFPDEMKQLYSKMGINMAGLNRDQYRIGIDVNQRIWDGGLTHAQNLITAAGSETEKQQIKVELYALRDRVNALYFGILNLEAQETQNANLQNLLKNNCDKIESMIRNHTALQSDLNAMKAELISTNQQHIQIESTTHSYRQMLSLFVHKDLSNTELVKPEVMQVNTERINRPELQLFDAQKSQLTSQRSAIFSSLRPQISAFAQGFYGNPGLNYFKDMMENKWTWNYTVGVKLKWNFGSLYTKKKDLANLDLARQRIETQKNTFLFNTMLQSTQQQNAIDEMKRILADDEEIINLRTSVRKASEAKLTNGIIDVHDLLRDITTENQAIIAKVSHEIELLNRIYKLKNTINP